jgi:hypothetical protein
MPVRPLLRLIRVKCSLLDLRPLYQSPDPIEQSLIGESGRQTMVMLDLAVELDAPVTHSIPPFSRSGKTTFACHFTTTERQFSFNAPRSIESGFNESASHQRRLSNRHRQALANLMHLCRNTGPEIVITAVVHAWADVCS